MEKIKVMIVDDSKVSRAILSGQLQKTNFEVAAEAKTAAEAVRLYENSRPAVVTMDMNLPDADGIDCSRRILELDPEAKIVMISAMKDASLISKGRDAGISAFLQKPVSTNELIDTLLLLCQKKASKTVAMREFYARPFARALQKGLLSIVGMQSDIDLESDNRHFIEIHGIAVVIGLTGTPTGRAIVSMGRDTMKSFAAVMLDREGGEESLSDEEASDSVEEAANIIVGRGVSNINNVFKDKEMRITPPGTICGANIRIASPRLTTFRITAKTRIGDISINVGFAEGD